MGERGLNTNLTVRGDTVQNIASSCKTIIRDIIIWTEQLIIHHILIFIKEKAAVDFGLFYNDNSIREDIEYGSSIYQVRNSNGQLGYTYTIAERGSKHGVTPSRPNLFRKVVADIHTHGAWSNGEYKDNEFSGIRDKKGNLLTSDKLQKVDTQNGDIGDSNRTLLTSFLVTPNGSLQSYDSKTGKIKVLSNNMPSDYRDPDRINSVSSYIEKHPVSIMKEASQKLKESINIIDR